MIISKFSEIIYSIYLLLLVCTYDLFLILSLELLFCASVHIRERNESVPREGHLINLWERPARDLELSVGSRSF